MAKRKISTANEVRAALAKPLSETPHAPKGKYKKVSSKQNYSWFWVIVVVTVLWGVCNINRANNGSSNSNEATDEEKSAVITAGESYIKLQLKSPSTAEFPSTFKEFDDIEKIDENQFSFNSYVDSQNSYGATLRTYFRCVVEKEGDDYRVVNLEFLKN